MRIKNYHCSSCKSTDFRLHEKGPHVGIYCNKCGRWLKWASSDEKAKFYLGGKSTSQSSRTASSNSVHRSFQANVGTFIPAHLRDAYPPRCPSPQSEFVDDSSSKVTQTKTTEENPLPFEL